MDAKRLSPMMCPSAQPDMAGAVAIGVVGGRPDEPRVAWIERPVPVGPELLAMAGAARPTEVFRFAGECEERACSHFDGSHCRLATRVVQILPAVVSILPACQIRSTCRWFVQEGRAACMRCPQVVTHTADPSEDLVRTATPA